MIPPWLKVTVVLASALLGAVIAWDVQDMRWTAATEQLKAEASAKLATATQAARSAERRNTLITEQLERTHAEATQKVQTTLADNRRLVRELGGMRDPGRRVSSADPAPGPATASGCPPTQTPDCRFSATLEDFLLSEAARADEAASYAGTCHEYAVKVSKQ